MLLGGTLCGMPCAGGIIVDGAGFGGVTAFTSAGVGGTLGTFSGGITVEEEGVKGVGDSLGGSGTLPVAILLSVPGKTVSSAFLTSAKYL